VIGPQRALFGSVIQFVSLRARVASPGIATGWSAERGKVRVDASN